MLDNGIIDKPDGSTRFCTDYRRVNAVTKTDSYPIPRIEACIDRIGKAQYITKCDLLKGYWAVLITDRVKEISSFITPEGAYQYKVMPIGMKNSPATFVRLKNRCLDGIPEVETYINDIVVYNSTWDDHIKTLDRLFQGLSEANLTINLSKSDFCAAEVKIFGLYSGIQLDNLK